MAFLEQQASTRNAFDIEFTIPFVPVLRKKLFLRFLVGCCCCCCCCWLLVLVVVVILIVIQGEQLLPVATICNLPATTTAATEQPRGVTKYFVFSTKGSER